MSAIQDEKLSEINSSVIIFVSDDKGDLLNPMGTVENNPNVDSAAGLIIRFSNIRPYPLYYPPLDKVPDFNRVYLTTI